MHPEPHILAPQVVKGYPQIKLGTAWQGKVHTLDGAQARHLDGNPLNCALPNLAWGTAAENYDDRRRHGTANDGERHGRAKLTWAQVAEIRASGEPRRILAERYGVTTATIGCVTTGRGWRPKEVTRV